MGFDYRYTCPTIDSNIKSIRQDLQNALGDLFNEYGIIPADDTTEIADSFYMSFIQYAIENIRETNEDIRKEAEKQIDKLETEIIMLKDEINELKSDIARLEDENSELNYQYTHDR